MNGLRRTGWVYTEVLWTVEGKGSCWSPTFHLLSRQPSHWTLEERSKEESRYLPWTSCPEEDGKNKREARSSSPPRCWPSDVRQPLQSLISSLEKGNNHFYLYRMVTKKWKDPINCNQDKLGYYHLMSLSSSGPLLSPNNLCENWYHEWLSSVVLTSLLPRAPKGYNSCV